MALTDTDQYGRGTIAPVPVQPPPPPVDFYGSPVFTPRPQPVVVDRQQYLTEQVEAQRRMREFADAQRQAELERQQRETLIRSQSYRAMGSREQLPQIDPEERARLDAALTGGIPQFTGIAIAEADRQLADLAWRRKYGFTKAELDQVRSISGEPLLPEVAAQRLRANETSITDSPVYRFARTEIPGVDEGINILREAPQMVGRGIDIGIETITPRRPRETPRERVERSIQTEGKTFEGIGDITGDVLGVGAEIIVPQEVWELALELTPFGTVADLRRAVAEGVPEAVAAIKRVADEPALRSPVVRALSAESGRIGLPPAPPPRQQFSPAVDDLMTRGADSGIDAQLFNNAVQGATNAPNPNAWPLKSYFNRARSLWDEAVIRNPDIQQAYLAATRYADAQYQRIQSIGRGVDTAVRQAFSNGNGVDPNLRAAFKGTSTPDLAPYIGTPWHFLDNPNLYDATPMQKQLAKSWDEITRNELRFSQSVGVPAAELDEAWIKHAFKDPDKVPRNFGGRAGAGLTKQRKLTTEEFVARANELGVEVDTDVTGILNRRLAASARVRSNMVYMDAAASATGGRKIAPGTVTPRGMQRIELGGQAWAIPNEAAKSVNDTLLPRSLAPDEAFAEKALDITRGTLLNLDFSAGLGRQFMLGFANDPLGAAKAWGRGWQNVLTPEGWTEWYAKNAPKAELWSQHGLQLRMSSLDIESQLKGVKGNPLDAIPGIKQLNALQFESILPLTKINTAERAFEMLKAQQKGGVGSFFKGLPIFDKLNAKLTKPLARYTDDELMDIAADVTNNWLGGIEWARVGKAPGLLRKFLLLTEGWTRAQLGAAINAPKLSPKGVLARRMLAQELMMGAGISTVGSLLMTGELPEYDPRKVRFLNVKTPIGDVPVMPHATLLRTIVQTMAGKAPDDIFGDESAIGQRLEAIFKFNEGRIGQLPRLGYELAVGEDYYGRPINNRAAFVARELSPIIAQGIMQDMEDGRRPRDIAIRAGLEFGGFNLRPFSATQKVDRAVVDEKIPKSGGGFYEHYRDLPPDIKGEFNKRHPDEVQQLKDYRASRDRDTFDQIAKTRDEGLEALRPLADSDPVKYRELRGDLLMRQSAIVEHELEQLDLDERTGDLKLLDDFYTATKKSVDPKTGEMDFDAYDRIVDSFRASHTPAERKRLDEMRLYSADPVDQELRRDKKALEDSGYFDKRDAAFETWKGYADEAPADMREIVQQMKTPEDLRRYAEKEAEKEGMGRENYTRYWLWKAWQKTLTNETETFLQGLGAVEDRAVRWGYQETIHNQAAYDAYKARTGLEPKLPQ